MKGPAKLLPMDLSFTNSIPFLNPLRFLVFKYHMVVRNTIIHYMKSVTVFYILVGISAGYSLNYDDKFLIFLTFCFLMWSLLP